MRGWVWGWQQVKLHALPHVNTMQAAMCGPTPWRQHVTIAQASQHDHDTLVS